MEITYTKQFLKDLASIPSARRKQIEFFVFEKLPSLSTISEIGKAEKMHGYDGYFKIRFGEYRLGFYSAGKGIELRRVLHRKEIYRYYP